MIKIDLPKILFKIWLGLFSLSALSFLIAKGLFATLLIVYPFLLPAIFLMLVIHKIFTREIRNQYFLPVFVLYVISMIVIFYLWSHAFDNFM